MHDFLIEMLVCPACHGPLTWAVSVQRGERVEEAEACCRACQATYPVREGIGLFLTPDLPRHDLWAQMDSRLAQYLRQHPEIERRLMAGPVETLAPADQFFRALILEERGEYGQARAIMDPVWPRLYTPEYRACCESQINHVVEHLAGAEGPVVDLASGRGQLVEALARRLARPVVATDFSPRVLRRDRRWLAFLGLDDQVSLLAFDARRTPFRDGAVETLTTLLGLPNVEQPGDLLTELRRIVSGTFLAISHFYPEEDTTNAEVINQAGLSTMLFRRSALEHLIAAGWEVTVANVCTGLARPTPTGVLLAEASIDSLPVAETTLEWCVLVAH